MTKDELLALFTKIDSNKDGAVTHQELFTKLAARGASKPAESKEPKADQPTPGRGRGMMPWFGRMWHRGMRGAPDRPRRPEGKSANSESKPADADKKQSDQLKPEKKETDAPKQQQPQQPEKEAKPAAEEAPKQTLNEASPVEAPVAETKTAAREAVLAEKP